MRTRLHETLITCNLFKHIALNGHGSDYCWSLLYSLAQFSVVTNEQFYALRAPRQFIATLRVNNFALSADLTLLSST